MANTYQQTDDIEINVWSLRKQAFDLAHLAKNDGSPSLGVLRKLEERDPAITSITICLSDNNGCDWDTVGRCIGSSPFIKFLDISYEYTSQRFNFVPFFKGLALNRSIEVLSLEILSDDMKNDFFEIMFPFFANNSNLRQMALEYGYGGRVTQSFVKALRATKSLNAISFRGHYFREEKSDELIPAEEELLEVVFTKQSLHQIVLEKKLTRESDSKKISSLLIDPKCNLKSLHLDYLPSQNISQNMAMIGNALAANTSIKSLTLHSDDPCPLIIASQFKNTLERLDLIYQYTFMKNHVGMDLAAALRHRQLKSLKLSYRMDMELWAAIFEAVLTPAAKLEEFILQEAEFIGDPLKSLGEHVRIVKSLKTLDLTSCCFRDGGDWRSFFSCLQGSGCQLENLLLGEIESGEQDELNDTVLPNLIRFLESNSTLKRLELPKCSKISATGWQKLLSLLHITAIEKLSGYQYNKGLSLTLLELAKSGKLKNVDFWDSDEPLPPGVSRILESPNCRLEELGILCCVDEPHEFLQSARELSESLRHNSTLKTLSVSFLSGGTDDDDDDEFVGWGLKAQFWHVYPNALYNTDSIEATFSSNHSLCSLKMQGEMVWKTRTYDSTDDENTQLELFSLLSLNQNENKSAVARRKVIRAHFSAKSSTQKLLDLNLGFNIMPQLLHWIGREEVELCMMYDFLRKMPYLFGHGPVNKRRWQEI